MTFIQLMVKKKMKRKKNIWILSFYFFMSFLFICCSQNVKKEKKYFSKELTLNQSSKKSVLTQLNESNQKSYTKLKTHRLKTHQRKDSNEKKEKRSVDLSTQGEVQKKSNFKTNRESSFPDSIEEGKNFSDFETLNTKTTRGSSFPDSSKEDKNFLDFEDLNTKPTRESFSSNSSEEDKNFLDFEDLNTKPVNQSLKFQEQPFPFRVGEKIVLNLWWTSFSIGQAILEVLPFLQTKGGEIYYKFSMTIKTHPWVSFLLDYKYEATSYALSHPSMKAYFIKTIESESGKIRQTQLRIHPSHLVAYYKESKTFSQKKIKSKEKGTLKDVQIKDRKKKLKLYSSDVRDLLNAIYYVRTLDLQSMRKDLVFPFIEKSNFLEGRVRLKEGGRLKTKLGTFDTKIAALDFKRLNHQDKKSHFKRIRFWFTKDEKKLIVKMELQVKKIFLRGYLNEFRVSLNHGKEK